jgi:hypothetical protein
LLLRSYKGQGERLPVAPIGATITAATAGRRSWERAGDTEGPEIYDRGLRKPEEKAVLKTAVTEV